MDIKDKQYSGLGFNGMPIHTSHLMTEFYRFPRSKKKRIIKKWRKNPKNHKPRTDALIMSNTWLGTHIVCHPTLIPKFEAAIKSFGR